MSMFFFMVQKLAPIPGLAAQIMGGKMSALVYLLGEVMQAVLDIVLHVFNIRVKKN
jgi:hypothetical protein